MKIDRLDVSVFTIPMEEPEADGTLAWDATTVVVVEVTGEGMEGLGFTYGPAACATLIQEKLKDQVTGRDPMDVPGFWEAMVRSIRNVGRPGVASMAIGDRAQLSSTPTAGTTASRRSALPEGSATRA